MRSVLADLSLDYGFGIDKTNPSKFTSVVPSFRVLAIDTTFGRFFHILPKVTDGFLDFFLVEDIVKDN